MCVSWFFLESLSVNGRDDGVRQVAQTLQSCLELADPVQQIQLVKKVSNSTIMSSLIFIVLALFNKLYV